MYVEKDIFTSPLDKSIKVWRYMSFAKLLDLLLTSELFFSCADKFDDPFEGSLTKPTFDKLNSWTNNSKSFQAHRESYRQITGISCWHMSHVESVAMWDLYLNNDEGVAIQSTFNHLVLSFNNTDKEIGLSEVRYIDYENFEFESLKSDGKKITFNFYEPFVHKRDFFSHENELRAIYLNNPSPDHLYTGPLTKDIHANHVMGAGTRVQVDLSELIQTIYISPRASGWFKELVITTLKKFDYNFVVADSKLRDNPNF